jgi:hypothetical protein
MQDLRPERHRTLAPDLGTNRCEFVDLGCKATAYGPSRFQVGYSIFRFRKGLFYLFITNTYSTVYFIVLCIYYMRRDTARQEDDEVINSS